jgi:hypothetical protein
MGKAVKAIAGAILFVAGLVTGNAFLINIGAQMFLSGVADVLTPKPRLPGDPGVQQEYTGGVEPRRIVYGTMRVSGLNVIPPLTSGASNEFLHQVLAVAGHEVNAITDVYFDQTAIASADIGAVSGTDADGLVGGAGAYLNLAWIRRYTGTSSQTADYILDTTFSAWTSSHRGRGIAYLAVRYKYNADGYKNGKPEVTCIVQGKKCYDPRLDSSPGANPTNASYIAYTNNPALHLADYLTDASVGLGETTGRINWTDVVTAANICDETPAIPSTTQKRYTSNVVLDCTARYEDNIKVLAGAMLGHCFYTGGKWSMKAGAWTSSAFSLSESDLTGSVEVSGDIPRKDKYNAVRGWFLDAARNYQQGEFQPVTNSGYESTDGERIWKEIQMAACTNDYECQRAAIILNRIGRRIRSATLTCGMSAYKIKLFETGTVTLAEIGWNAQTVRCMGWTFTADGQIQIQLREEASTDWSDPSAGTYTVPGSNTIAVPDGFTPTEPLNFSAQQVLDGILFSWEPPTLTVPGTTYTIYEYTSSTPLSSATAVASGLTGTSRTLIKVDTTTRYYWIKAVAPNGNLSGPTPTTTGISGRALSISAGFRMNPNSLSLGKTGTASTLTTAAASAVVVGGTPGYTYSWVYTSGDTSITCSANTTINPTFSRASMAVDDEFDGVWTLTTTDSLSATCTCVVGLHFHRISYD